MNSKRNKYLYRTICLGLTLLMSISLVGLFLSAEAGLGVLSKSSLMVAVVESDYEQSACDEFQAYYKDILSANGFNISDAGEAFNENRFKTDLGKVIKKRLAGKSPNVKISSEVNLLKDNLTLVLINKGYLIDSPTENAIESIANEVADYYESFTQFSFGSYYYNAKIKMDSRLIIVLPILFGLLLFSILGLFLVTKHKTKFCEYLRFGALGAVIPNAYIFFMIMFGQREFLDQSGYYYDLIERLYEFSIMPFIFTELILLISWALLRYTGRHGKQL